MQFFLINIANMYIYILLKLIISLHRNLIKRLHYHDYKNSWSNVMLTKYIVLLFADVLVPDGFQMYDM